MIVKKDKSKLHFIQDPRKVNIVTIRDTRIPLVINDFGEIYSRYPIYIVFDLVSRYDQIPLDQDSQDLFGLLTPIGLIRIA